MKLTERKLKKMIKEEKRRRFARGVGAAAGTITSLLAVALLFGREFTGKDR